MGAGSFGSIAYIFFQLVDEILHFFERFSWLDWVWGDWRARFCSWCYRKELEEYDPADEWAYESRAWE